MTYSVSKERRMAKEFWVVGSALNPLILADSDWQTAATLVEATGMKVFDNKADHDTALALIKGEK
jgi:hypothetical protein